MTDSISIRVDGALATALADRAKRTGATMNGTATELLRRELEFDLREPARAVQLPVALGPKGDEWEEQVEKSQHNWAVVYREPDSTPILAYGKLHLLPMFAVMTLHVSHVTLTIPRVNILGWAKLSGTENDILSFAYGLQNGGIYLHEHVEVTGREVNHVHYPRGRGPRPPNGPMPTAQAVAPRPAKVRPKRKSEYWDR